MSDYLMNDRANAVNEKVNNSKKSSLKFLALKDQYELLISHSNIEYDKLNISIGNKLLKEALALKDELLINANHNNLEDLFWLASKNFMDAEEAYKALMNSNNNQYLIVDNNLKKLVEECGELAQIAMKVSLHGIDSHNPKTGEGNYELIQKEMTDVIASVRRTAKLLHVALPDEMIDERVTKLTNLFG